MATIIHCSFSQFKKLFVYILLTTKQPMPNNLPKKKFHFFLKWTIKVAIKRKLYTYYYGYNKVSNSSLIVCFSMDGQAWEYLTCPDVFCCKKTCHSMDLPLSNKTSNFISSCSFEARASIQKVFGRSASCPQLNGSLF